MAMDFLLFWKSVNDILRSRSLPEMLYGEARDWYNEATTNKW